MSRPDRYAVVLTEPGGPERFRLERFDAVDPTGDEVRVRHEAVGFNFIDTYHRRGLYPLATYPAVLGIEGAGVVEAAGPAARLPVGARVAYVAPTPGSYATHRTVSQQRVVELPSGVDTKAAAALMVKGLTARYLLLETARVGDGSVIVVYAAAGGVGSLLVQWGRHLGATVIGVVSSPAKAVRARAHGCRHVIVTPDESIAERVSALTDGRGADVVYDSIGAPTLADSLVALRRRGLLVSYGQSSGTAPQIDVGELGRAGSVFATRPRLNDYIADRSALEGAADDLFAALSGGAVRGEIGATYALSHVADAHRDAEARRTTGSVVLVP